MNDNPPTQQTLLLRLAGGDDREAWAQFVEIYAPVVFQYARRRGLQDSDAADVMQDVLMRVADAFRRRKYDGSRGSFRGWLLTITRNEVFDWLDGHSRRERAGGGTSAQQILAEGLAVRADLEDDGLAFFPLLVEDAERVRPGAPQFVRLIERS